MLADYEHEAEQLALEMSRDPADLQHLEAAWPRPTGLLRRRVAGALVRVGALPGAARSAGPRRCRETRGSAAVESGSSRPGRQARRRQGFGRVRR